MRPAASHVMLGVSLFAWACSHDSGPSPTVDKHDAARVTVVSTTPSASAATPSPPSAVKSASASSAVLTDGAHDYRGTLGKKTPISAHLVRAGQSVTGSYTYTSVGRPISLAGTIDGAGTLLLTESAGGKTGGTMSLRPAGTDLVGEWTSADKKSVFPVHLSHGEVSPARRAEECLADARCAAAEADRLFVAADDAHSADLDCFRFLDGAGTRRDLVRGRACLERSVGEGKCEGSSPDLARAELAMMRIDGTGGPEDLARARALFTGCADDITTGGVLAHADAKAHDPRAPAVDFCKAIGGTTLVANECGARARTADEARVALAAKAVVATLDPDATRLFVEASTAHAAYVSAMGGYAYEVYIQGTVRNAMALGREQELEEARAKEIEGFTRYVAPETTPADVTRAEKKAAAALAAVTAATPGEKAALAKTQTTWTTYRDAEVRFYAQALGAKQGKERVERAIRVKLATERAKLCEAPSLQGN